MRLDARSVRSQAISARFALVLAVVSIGMIAGVGTRARDGSAPGETPVADTAAAALETYAQAELAEPLEFAEPLEPAETLELAGRIEAAPSAAPDEAEALALAAASVSAVADELASPTAAGSERPKAGADRDVVSAAPAERADPAVVAAYPAVDIESLPRHAPDPALTSTWLLKAEGELKRGQTLGQAMKAQGVSASTVHLIVQQVRPVYDFRHAQPGHTFELSQTAGGELVEFRYRLDAVASIHLQRRAEGGFDVAREEAELLPRQVRIAGVVSSTLYEAIGALGEDPKLANLFANIFAWDIDFSRSVRPGDSFNMLYERLYRTDTDGSEVFVRFGRVLAARYDGGAGEYEAVYYQPDEGRAGYYRPDGTSVERQFLATPMEFARITSRYSNARRHPILKVTRPHHGIDYAAPAGTPVWTVANGTVVYRGWGGGFGNLVKVRHANGYISYYAHLSRFAKNVHVGQQVSQRDVIGYVGSTGLATGPHVCFRIAKDGRYVNPMRIQSPAGDPISAAEIARFHLSRDTLLADLDASGSASVAEAF